MKLSNQYGLPETIVKAVQNDSYSSFGDISTTRLIAPPQQVQLLKRHDAEIEVDVSSKVWSMFGQAVHTVLERANPGHGISERRFSTTVNGWVVSGQIDRFENGILYDYKVTKVYAFTHGPSEEWIAQGNVNRWLMHKEAGIEVVGLKNVLMLKDWDRYKAKSPKYPYNDVVLVDLPLWSLEETEAFVLERVKLHQEAAKLADNELPSCSEEETWGGRRCETWCAAKSFCSQVNQ